MKIIKKPYSPKISKVFSHVIKEHSLNGCVRDASMKIIANLINFMLGKLTQRFQK